MKIPIPFLAFLLSFFINDVNSDERLKYEDSYPVSKCFCQSRTGFKNITINVKKTSSKIVTHYSIYNITTGVDTSDVGPHFNSPIDKDLNYTYNKDLKKIKSIRINLVLQKNIYILKTVPVFIYPANQSNCNSDKAENRRCIINVDLKKITEDLKQTVPIKGEEGKSKEFVCQRDGAKSLSWRLQYDNGLEFIEYPKLHQYWNITYELHFEKFDNNMKLQCRIDKDEIVSEYILSVTGDGKNEKLPIKNYTNADKIPFKCDKKDSSVGVVDPNNGIILHHSPFMKSFTKEDSGTVLCCIYNTTKKNKIKRHVTDKTLLVYYQDSESQENIDNAGSDYKMFFIAAGIATCTLILFIIIAVKCRIKNKKSSSQQQLELETYADRVIYAEITNLAPNSTRTNITNATPYATIIGSLHPKE